MGGERLYKGEEEMWNLGVEMISGLVFLLAKLFLLPVDQSLRWKDSELWTSEKL